MVYPLTHEDIIPLNRYHIPASHGTPITLRIFPTITISRPQSCHCLEASIPAWSSRSDETQNPLTEAPLQHPKSPQTHFSSPSTTSSLIPEQTTSSRHTCIIHISLGVVIDPRRLSTQTPRIPGIIAQQIRIASKIPLVHDHTTIERPSVTVQIQNRPLAAFFALWVLKVVIVIGVLVEEICPQMQLGLSRKK